MADTTFVNGTVIQPAWLNDVNDVIYHDSNPILGSGATGDGVADDTAELNASLASSLYIDLGGPDKSYLISGPLTLRTGHVIVGHGATITQTLAQVAPGDAVEIFNCTSKTDIDISGINFVGVSTDTIESDSSRACAVYGATAQTRVHIHDCRFTGFAYTPVRFVGATSCSFVNNVVVGPGSPELTAVTSGKNYGVLFDTGCVDCLVSGNSISKCAQGVRVEASDDIRIANNYIFDITGQHGIYAGSDLRNLTIVGNVIYDTDLCGIKVQAADGTDSFGVVISGNSVSTTGDQGILLTNGTAGAGRIKNFSITGNVVKASTASSINLQHSNSGVVSGNTLNTPTTYGVNLKACDDVVIANNSINSTVLTAIIDESASTKIVVSGNQINNCATAATVSDRYGIRINTCTGWVVDGNVLSDSNSKMDYGIFVSGGDQTTLVVTNNIVKDSVLTGFRGKAGPEAIRTYSGNYWGGPIPTTTDPIVPTVASATALTIPQDQDVVIVSGTTTITSVLVGGHTGRRVTLIFSGILTFTDGSNLLLAGNFVTTANDTITIACDGLNWYEVARSVN
jgi:parallel beta-helix repeat protein